MGGKPSRDHIEDFCDLLRRYRSPHQSCMRIWNRVRQAGSLIINDPLLADSLLETQRYLLDESIRYGDTKSTEELIEQGTPVPGHIKQIHFCYTNTTLVDLCHHRRECIKILLEAGTVIDPDIDDYLHWDAPGEPDLLTDWLWCHRHDRDLDIYSSLSKRMRICVTVSGICGAASQSVESLDKYMKGKTHPAHPMKQEILQVALSEASAQSRMPVVRVLLEYGVDPEVGLLMAREWPQHDGKRQYTARSYEWLPSFRAVRGKNIELITLLAERGVCFDRQEIMDATIDGGWKDDGRGQQGDIRPVIDLLLQYGLEIQLYGPKTMLKALGVLDYGEQHWKGSPNWEPDGVIIEVLQELGVVWDQNYFERTEQLSLWREHNKSNALDTLEAIVRPEELDGKKFGGKDLLQTAVRKGCSKATIRYMLDCGIPLHSKPFKMDGKSILHAALDHTSCYQVEIVMMLLEHLTDIEADPVWPNLLEISMGLICHGYDSDVFDVLEYATSRGATLLLPKDHVEAKRRFNLLSRLLRCKAPGHVIQYIWDNGVSFARLREADHLPVLEAMIQSGAYNWAHSILEQGISIEWSYILSAAAANSDCPLWFIRYLLERNNHTTDIARPSRGDRKAPLQSAAEAGNLSIACLLMENGANVNEISLIKRPHSGDYWRLKELISVLAQPISTPLDIASFMGRLDMVKLLIDCGGHSSVPGLTGFDGALKAARRERHGGIVMLIESKI